MKKKSEMADLFWSIAPILVFAILVIALVMVSTESLDKIIFGG